MERCQSTDGLAVATSHQTPAGYRHWAGRLRIGGRSCAFAWGLPSTAFGATWIVEGFARLPESRRILDRRVGVRSGLVEIADEVADAGCKLIAEDASQRSVLNDRPVPRVGHSAEPGHRLDPLFSCSVPGRASSACRCLATASYHAVPVRRCLGRFAPATERRQLPIGCARLRRAFPGL